MLKDNIKILSGSLCGFFFTELYSYSQSHPNQNVNYHAVSIGLLLSGGVAALFNTYIINSKELNLFTSNLNERMLFENTTQSSLNR